MEQQDAFAPCSISLQQGANSAGLPIQSRESQLPPFRLSIEQVAIDALLRMAQGAPAECFDERGKLDIGNGGAAIYLCRFRLENPSSRELRVTCARAS
jgi:hypothetical protein